MGERRVDGGDVESVSAEQLGDGVGERRDGDGREGGARGPRGRAQGGERATVHGGGPAGPCARH